MTQPISHEEAADFINRLSAQSNAPATPPNAVHINCAGIVTQVDLSALPSGTLINSYVTGEFFKVAPDHWATTGCPDAHYTDAGVATQVFLGWDADEQESDFHLIHVGD